MLACPAIPGNLILGEGTVRACAAALEAVLGGGEAASAKAAAALAKIEAQEGLGEAAAPQAGAEALPVQDIETNQARGRESCLPLGFPAVLCVCLTSCPVKACTAVPIGLAMLHMCCGSDTIF